MICLEKSTFLYLALFLFLIGTILVYRAFKCKSKEVLDNAVIGVIILLLSGNVVIYLYSHLPTPERIFEELHKEELPDLGMSCQKEGVSISSNKRSTDIE